MAVQGTGEVRQRQTAQALDLAGESAQVALQLAQVAVEQPQPSAGATVTQARRDVIPEHPLRQRAPVSGELAVDGAVVERREAALACDQWICGVKLLALEQLAARAHQTLTDGGEVVAAGGEAGDAEVEGRLSPLASASERCVNGVVEVAQSLRQRGVGRAVVTVEVRA